MTLKPRSYYEPLLAKEEIEPEGCCITYPKSRLLKCGAHILHRAVWPKRDQAQGQMNNTLGILYLPSEDRTLS